MLLFSVAPKSVFDSTSSFTIQVNSEVYQMLFRSSYLFFVFAPTWAINHGFAAATVAISSRWTNLDNGLICMREMLINWVVTFQTLDRLSPIGSIKELRVVYFKKIIGENRFFDSLVIFQNKTSGLKSDVQLVSSICLILQYAISRVYQGW